MPSASHAAQPSVLNWVQDVYTFPESQRPPSPSSAEDSRADSPVLGDTEGKKPVYVDIIVDLEPKSTSKSHTPPPTKKSPSRPPASLSGPRDRRDKHPRALPPLPPMAPMPPLPRTINPNQYPRNYPPSPEDDPTLFYNNMPSRIPASKSTPSLRSFRDPSKRRGFVGTPEFQDHYRTALPPPPPPPPPQSLYMNPRRIRPRPPPSRYSEDSIEGTFPLPPPLRRPPLSTRSNSTTSTITSSRTPSLMTPTTSEYSSFSESESEFDSHDAYMPPPSIRNNRVRLGVRTQAYDYDVPAFEFAHIVEGAGEWRWHSYDDERAYQPPPQPTIRSKPRWDTEVVYDDWDRLAPPSSYSHMQSRGPVQYREHPRRRAVSQRSNETLPAGRAGGYRQQTRGAYLAPPTPAPALPPPSPPKPQTKRGKFMNFVMNRLAWRPAPPKKAVSLPPPSLRNRSQVSLDPSDSIASLAPPLPNQVHGSYYDRETSFDEESEYHNGLRPIESRSSHSHGPPVHVSNYGGRSDKPNVSSLKSFFFS